jgi:hypothetical protein
MKHLFRLLLAAIIIANSGAASSAATWDSRVQEKSVSAGICVTGLVAGILQTAACGTVSSVALSLPGIFSVSGSPVTGAGTLTGALANQTANYIFAGPTSGGAAAPTFRAAVCADLPAGSKCLLNTLTASNSASLQDTTSITATFKHYEIVFENIVPATANADCKIQIHTGGAYQTANYLAVAGVFRTASSGQSGPTTYIPCGTNQSDASNSEGISGSIKFSNPSTAHTKWHGLFSQLGSAFSVVMVGGFYNASGSIDGFQVSMSSGNIASGVIYVYGWN